MTTITLIKTLPSSSYYTGSGATTITFTGINNFEFDISKTLQKTPIPRSKSRQSASPSDQPTNKAIDLQRSEEVLKLKGWLEDDSSETAWNKAWKLRAMCSMGGPLTSLTIGETGDSEPPKLVFDGSGMPQAFIEKLSFSINPNDTGAITAALTDKEVGRIEVTIAIYFGTER